MRLRFALVLALVLVGQGLAGCGRQAADEAGQIEDELVPASTAQDAESFLSVETEQAAPAEAVESAFDPSARTLTELDFQQLAQRGQLLEEGALLQTWELATILYYAAETFFPDDEEHRKLDRLQAYRHQFEGARVHLSAFSDEAGLRPARPNGAEDRVRNLAQLMVRRGFAPDQLSYVFAPSSSQIRLDVPPYESQARRIEIWVEVLPAALTPYQRTPREVPASRPPAAAPALPSSSASSPPVSPGVESETAPLADPLAEPLAEPSPPASSSQPTINLQPGLFERGLDNPEDDDTRNAQDAQADTDTDTANELVPPSPEAEPLGESQEGEEGNSLGEDLLELLN